MELHLVLLDFWDLKEMEQMDAITRDGTSIHEASLFAIAYHEPKRLQSAETALRSRIRRFNGTAEPTPSGARAALREWGQKMLARMREQGILAPPTEGA